MWLERFDCNAKGESVARSDLTELFDEIKTVWLLNKCLIQGNTLFVVNKIYFENTRAIER